MYIFMYRKIDLSILKNQTSQGVMERTYSDKYEDIDPEEIFQRLKRLLDIYDKKIENHENEKELSNTSLS